MDLQCLDVLDLPQLYTKPSAESLLEVLDLLTSGPPSWDPSNNDDTNDDTQGSGVPGRFESNVALVNPPGIASYLTSIVSSGLKWIEDENARENIWHQASLRLSERSGRTAMGAISRRFRIPSPDSVYELSIHEPALTGDDLGLKTWAASYLLAKRLHTFDIVKSRHSRAPQVLELGSGTGLVGMAMAARGADVVLTDLPSIVHNMARNARENATIIQQNGGSTRCGILDWTDPTSCQLLQQEAGNIGGDKLSLNSRFPIILAADSLYSPSHPRWLVETIQVWLSDDVDAKVIVEFPLRDAYLPEVREFGERMKGIGLWVMEEGQERGYDDWGWSGADENNSEQALVTCWWSCWGRRPPSLTAS